MDTRHTPLRVGFDLDGVILYNPARLARPIIALIKRIFFHKKHVSFYVPHKKWEIWLFRLFHKTSIFISPSMRMLKTMAKNKDIEAYIVTARYGFLKDDFESWLKKINANMYFKQCILNEKNMQPHIYKKEIIEQLDLDVFVEDNWDIVHYLSTHTHATIIWIYNLFDKGIEYPRKFPSLGQALAFIRSSLLS